MSVAESLLIRVTCCAALAAVMDPCGVRLPVRVVVDDPLECVCAWWRLRVLCVLVESSLAALGATAVVEYGSLFTDDATHLGNLLYCLPCTLSDASFCRLGCVSNTDRCIAVQRVHGAEQPRGAAAALPGPVEGFRSWG